MFSRTQQSRDVFMVSFSKLTVQRYPTISISTEFNFIAD